MTTTKRVSVEEKDGVLQVEVWPYSRKFGGVAKNAGGYWDKDKGCYVFDIRCTAVVQKILMDVYGLDGTPIEMISIKITAKQKIVKTRCAVEMLSRTIAEATSWNKPAKVGPGVTLVSGKIDSGGSMKYCKTEIDEGAVFVVHDMPITVLGFKSNIWEIEYYDPMALEPTYREALESELAHIKAREAQIIEMLEGNPPHGSLPD